MNRWNYYATYTSDKALGDPNYVEQRLNELKLVHCGNAWTKARVQQWVAGNYPTNAPSLIIPRATIQLPSMQQNTAPYPTMAMANYYLQNLYPFNPYFQGAMRNYSMGYVPMYPQPTGNPNSQMRSTVSVNMGASTSQAVFGRPRTPTQLIQLDQRQSVHLAGPPSTVNTGKALSETQFEL